MILIKPKRAKEIKTMLCGCEDCVDMNLFFTNLQSLGKKLEENEVYNDIVTISLALASKERLIIINALKEKDRCVCELEAVLDKSQSTISHHLRKLVNAGLIEGWKKDKFTYYHLYKEKIQSFISHLNQEFDL